LKRVDAPLASKEWPPYAGRMESINTPPSLGSPAKRTPVLAMASLALGILGLMGSILVVGVVFALVGLILGAMHLRRREGSRRLGWTGVWLSAFGVVASLGFAVFYAIALPRFAHGMQRSGARGFDDWVGKPAPELAVTTLEGNPLKLSDLRGRRVVLDFWATWCGPCVMEIPHFARLQRESGTQSLAIVGLSQEDRAVLKKFVDTHDVPYAVASVSAAALPDPYADVQAIPTTFFLDENGVIEHVAVGYHEFEVLKRHALGTPASGDSPAP